MFSRSQTLRILTAHFAFQEDSIRRNEGVMEWGKFIRGCTSCERSRTREQLREMDCPKLIRYLTKPLPECAPETFSIAVEGKTVIWQGQIIGHFQILYKAPLPGEPQARLAYESLIDQYLFYLCRSLRAVAVDNNNLITKLFIPKNENLHWDYLWEQFVKKTFSEDSVSQNFALLINSVKLADRGISAPDIPIVSDGQRIALAGFYDAVMRRVERIVNRADRESQEGAGKPSEVKKRRQDAEKFHKNYDELLDVWRHLKALHKDETRRIRLFSERFTDTAANQISPDPNKLRKGVRIFEDLLKMSEKDFYRLDPVLNVSPLQMDKRSGGDNLNLTCYACGRAFSNADELLSANKFIFADPSQRSQSGGSQGQPAVCKQCVVISFASPIKLNNQSVVLKVKRSDHGPDMVRQELQDTLRMLTLAELHLIGGRYILLQCTETVEQNLLISKMGRKEYALFKVASLFPAEILRDYQFVLVEGTSDVRLPSSHLTWLSRLMEVFSIDFFRLRHDSAGLARFFNAVRRIEQADVISAIYLMIGAIQVSSYNSTAMAALETLRSEHVEHLKKEKGMEAIFYEDIAGLTGILFAFCEGVATSEGRGTDKAKREVKKVIEDSYGPNEFSYGLVKHSQYRGKGRLIRTPATHFRFRHAERLLREALESDFNEQERLVEKDGQTQLLLYFPDDVQLVFTKVISRYQDESKQKQLTTQLKLSLASCFPEYYYDAKKSEA